MNTTAMLWTGRVLTGLFALFMLGASIAPKLLRMPVADETMAQLGWPPGYVLMIGLIELALLVLYLIPRTSVLGAVLMMGLLGGAMATQIRAGFRLDARGKPVRIDHPGYWQQDAFYFSVGKASAIDTCNQWVASRLRLAGVKAPLWSPFVQGLVWRYRGAQPNKH